MTEVNSFNPETQPAVARAMFGSIYDAKLFLSVAEGHLTPDESSLIADYLAKEADEVDRVRQNEGKPPDRMHTSMNPVTVDIRGELVMPIYEDVKDAIASIFIEANSKGQKIDDTAQKAAPWVRIGAELHRATQA